MQAVKTLGEFRGDKKYLSIRDFDVEIRLSPRSQFALPLSRQGAFAIERFILYLTQVKPPRTDVCAEYAPCLFRCWFVGIANVFKIDFIEWLLHI